MNVVISDPKTGKAYSKKTEHPVFLNKKINDVVDLSIIGLHGYSGKITGGSDKQGFPMKPNIEGTGRRKIFSGKSIGFKKLRKGERKRKNVRGEVVSDEIVQLNISLTAYGQKKLEELFAVKETKEEEKEKEKEKTAEKEGVKEKKEEKKEKDIEKAEKREKEKVEERKKENNIQEKKEKADKIEENAKEN